MRIRASSSRSVSERADRSVGDVRIERDGPRRPVLAAEELAPQTAADGRQEVEDGVGPVLPGPLLHDEPRRREELAEELLAVLPLPAPAPRSFPATVDQAREEDLDQHAADEGVGAGLPEQDPDQAGGLLALARPEARRMCSTRSQGVGHGAARCRSRARDGTGPGPGRRPAGATGPRRGSGRWTAIRRPSGR